MKTMVRKFVKAAFGMLAVIAASSSIAQSHLTHDGTFRVPAAAAFVVRAGIYAPTSGFSWRYRFSTNAPASNWNQNSFDDNNWSRGRGSFNRGSLQPNDASTNITWPDRPADSSITLWARSTFNLSDLSQVSSLMFWGRWDDNIRIYINGVLAVDAFPPTPAESRWVADYRYLGMSDAARASLVKGTNRVAIQVVDISGNAHLNLGIVKSHSMAKLPIRGYAKNSSFETIVKQVGKNMSLYGVSAGSLTIALERDGEPEVFASAGLGYMTKALSKPVPRHTVFRLASLDKPVVRSAIRKLISDATPIFIPGGGTTTLTNNTRVFPLLRQLLVNEGGLSGAPAGSRIDEVRISQFFDGNTGIVEGDGNTTTDLAYLRWIYRQGVLTEGGYNNAHFVLRYLVHRIALANGYGGYNDYIQDFLLEDSDDKNMYIAWQTLDKRVRYKTGSVLNEPWYALGRAFWPNELGLGGAATTDAYAKYRIHILPEDNGLRWDGAFAGTLTWTEVSNYTDSSGRARRYTYSLFLNDGFEPRGDIRKLMNDAIRRLPCQAWSASGVCQ